MFFVLRSVSCYIVVRGASARWKSWQREVVSSLDRACSLSRMGGVVGRAQVAVERARSTAARVTGMARRIPVTEAAERCAGRRFSRPARNRTLWQSSESAMSDAARVVFTVFGNAEEAF